MVTLKVKEDSKQAKAFIELAKTLPFVKIEGTESGSPYDPEFVAEIKKRVKNAKGKKLTRVDPDNVWESIL